MPMDRSLIALTVALSASFAVLGYQAGSLASTWKSRSPPAAKVDSIDAPIEEPLDIPDEEDISPEDIPDGDLSAVSAGFLEPCKMVLIVRTDLKLSPGAIATQNATLACYKALAKTNPTLVNHWEYTGQAKIALKGKSEDQLLELEAIAKSLNLCARSVQDPSLGENVRTVLAIGPGPVGLINEVTGKLRLL